MSQRSATLQPPGGRTLPRIATTKPAWGLGVKEASDLLGFKETWAGSSILRFAAGKIHRNKLLRSCPSLTILSFRLTPLIADLKTSSPPPGTTVSCPSIERRPVPVHTSAATPPSAFLLTNNLGASTHQSRQRCSLGRSVLGE